MNPSSKHSNRQSTSGSSNPVEALFTRALEQHQNGRLTEAQTLYQQVLEINPLHFDALHFLGVVFYQTKRPQQAFEAISTALKINANSAAAYCNRGLVLKELGRLDDAIHDYTRATEIKPDFAIAFYNRGNALYELRQLDAAAASYRQAFSLNPGFAEAIYKCGNTLYELNRLREAVDCYDHLITLNPKHAEAYFSRGLALKKLNQLEAAVASYDRAIALRPQSADIYSNRGVALYELNQLNAALDSLDRAIELDPSHAGAYANRGSVYVGLRQFNKAVADYNQAIKHNPNIASTHNYRACSLMQLKQIEAAIQDFQQAINLAPDFAGAKWNLSLCQLLLGNYAAGWQNYEARWQAKVLAPEDKRNLSQPLWLGNASLQGKTILLYAEQGLGDTIQFCRYAKLVADLGAKVILEVQRPLTDLLSQLDGVSQIVAKGDVLPAFDFQCPLLSLPLAFQTTLQTIPAPSRYIQSDPDKVAQWQNRLGEKTKPRIGIVWSGSMAYNVVERSIALSEFLKLLSGDCQFISLQKEIRESDKAALQANPQILFLGDELTDFSDTAALCDLMDAVISIDTSVAHLACAMGKPVSILLAYVPDWRWLLDKTDNPWYPTARLYRQDAPDNWNGVIGRYKLPANLFGL